MNEFDDTDDGASDSGLGCFSDPRSMDEVRTRTLESIGPEHGWGVLYGIGLNQGLVDGLRIARDFDTEFDCSPELTGGPIPMVFSPGGFESGQALRGTLVNSTEVELHLDRYPASEDPICWITAGYAAGWYTALLGEPYLVKETACGACGREACEFEARPLSTWERSKDPWARILLPYLDFERMREAALEKIDEAEGVASEGSMMGGFDPMSPAVHVWGSVMVLPYSGLEDSQAALEAIQEDLGPAQLQVVVVDVTGADIDSIEAAGLLQLIDTLTACSLETVLVGMSDEAAKSYMRPGNCLALPLLAADITEGISLAFQISMPDPISS